ncbi:hypothetical protein BJ741DRAFT_582074 [Chytriomyces cf. hyalinus JEL632]|nr:hypothetical protein BJ741DRAFT_582074 [Chytriomyces cf. hyalinus JEL632]
MRRMCRMISLPQFLTGLFKIKQVRCILLVPVRQIKFQLMQQRFHPMSIGREEYFQLTGINNARKQRKFLRKKEGPEEIQTQMPTCKTTSLGTLLEYTQYSSHHYGTLYAHRKKLRKLNFTQKVRWGIGMGVLIKKLCRGNVLRLELSHVYGEKIVCFLLGDGGAWFGDITVSKSSNAEILEASVAPSMGEGSSHGQRMGHFEDLLGLR